MEAIEAVEVIEVVDVPTSRICRDRTNPFEAFNNEEFKQRFRFNKQTFQLLLQLLSSDLEHCSAKNNFIPPVLQLAVALRFYATGNFQMTDGDLIGLSQPSVCRIVARVSISIASKKQHFIQFPPETERLVIKQQFKNVGGIPGVVGCIECSHIPISSPGGENAEIFRNRKGHFSVNVQAVCDPSLRFINLVCRWPGSTHDSRIFDNSALRAMLENNEIEGILLGDGGYACRHYMLTPLHNPTTSKERKYNQAHIKTRGKVERMFGVWK